MKISIINSKPMGMAVLYEADNSTFQNNGKNNFKSKINTKDNFKFKTNEKDDYKLKTMRRIILNSNQMKKKNF